VDFIMTSSLIATTVLNSDRCLLDPDCKYSPETELAIMLHRWTWNGTPYIVAKAGGRMIEGGEIEVTPVGQASINAMKALHTAESTSLYVIELAYDEKPKLEDLRAKIDRRISELNAPRWSYIAFVGDMTNGLDGVLTLVMDPDGKTLSADELQAEIDADRLARL
jgi:hypothetical protein